MKPTCIININKSRYDWYFDNCYLYHNASFSYWNSMVVLRRYECLIEATYEEMSKEVE